MSDRAGILFTTFEPSGDMLAAGVVTVLRREHPDLPIYALGGPRLEAAGATLLEHTTEHASMGLSTLAQAFAHKKRLGRLGAWLKDNNIRALIPVDSPAANWSICKLVRTHRPEARIIHLVAPQLWAWGEWRIRRMRRLSDHALCILPFEPQWFTSRGVPATFVGHPVCDPACHKPVDDDVADLPAPHPRLGLLPGSRTGEIRKNWPTMLAAFMQLKSKHPELQAVIAALDTRLEGMIRQITQENAGAWPDGLEIVVGRVESVLRWCDAVLVTSGTATLQVAARGRPMVAMYNLNQLLFRLFAQWLISTRTFTLPNLISEWLKMGRVMPEFVPHYGQVEPIVREVDRLLSDEHAMAAQRKGLSRVVAALGEQCFSQEAARRIGEMAGLRLEA